MACQAGVHPSNITEENPAKLAETGEPPKLHVVYQL